ncbi:hypothetical protein LTSEMIS_0437 [Salmonella enterica subsp. enterica serovar Mississippi str. A4-633]|nr:hypothetical protein LTSEMIS_0437 [Salmonella enterica subsp. enterica serovar Mississippi str. A4-633]
MTNHISQHTPLYYKEKKLINFFFRNFSNSAIIFNILST